MGTYFDHVTDTDYNIEFVTGMTVHPESGDMLISFGFQDNASFILRMPQKLFMDFIKDSG
jgi:hypothetical protein